MKTRPRLYLWLATTAALALTLVSQLISQHTSQAQGNTTKREIHLTWAFHPETFQEARDRAQLIVLAQVVSVEQGTDLVAPLPQSLTGQDRVPTQRITLQGDQGLPRPGNHGPDPDTLPDWLPDLRLQPRRPTLSSRRAVCVVAGARAEQSAADHCPRGPLSGRGE